MRLPVVIAITLVVGLDVTTAHADCTSDAAALREHLTAEAHRGDNWNTAWALGFGGAAALQVTMAHEKINPIGDYSDAFGTSLYVGAAKAGLGMSARIVLPLRIRVPEPVSDPCDDLRSLQRALHRTAIKEQRTFWLTIIGGLAVNLAGSIYVWAAKDAFGIALQSFLVGAPIGPISAFTAPRNSLRRDRKPRVELTVGIGSIGGRF